MNILRITHKKRADSASAYQPFEYSERLVSFGGYPCLVYYDTAVALLQAIPLSSAS